jgi:serine/threonine protein kinase
MSTPTGESQVPCPVPETLEKLLRDELDPTEAGPVEEHVGACPGCQRVLGRLVGSLPELADTPRLLGYPHGTVDEDPPALSGYAPLGRVDAGGMGVVWRVRDLQFGRDLAVKVMASWGRAAPRLIERFLAEARVCAQLTHPFIVPVHAMGRLADGRPYYTMKLVEGRTLAALLGEGPAPAGRRMEFVQVFGQVCQAVAFAHSRGVIHRDLKPENIMVGAHGEVQLMDWGLAKVLADSVASPHEEAETPGVEAGGADGTRTRAGSVLGTVAYMAPEQSRGLVEEVDRQSDVFGLGGILCKILTGEPPYTGPNAEAVRLRAAEADLGEALARLRGCGADPELTRLAERCLTPRKADRPADAGAVATDLAAYVSGVEERLQEERLRREREQVQAAEERRRRRLWMGLAASVLVAVFLLAAGLVAVNHLRRQEQDAKDLAQRREQETRTVLDELSSTVIDDWLARQPQLSPEQKEFLRKGLAYYENFTRETGQTPQGRAALAQAHRRVGTIRRQLGLLPEAEEALRRSAELAEDLILEFPAVTAYQRQAAETLQGLAVVLKDRGDYRMAAPISAEAIRYQQGVVQRDSGDAAARADLANMHNFRGALLNDLRQWDEAETSLGAALTILKELVEEFPTNPLYRQNLAAAHRTRGILFDAQGKDEEAETSVRQALAILKQLVADFPQNTWFRLKLAQSYTGLGITLTKRNRLDEARDAHDQAIAILKPLVANFPSIPKYRQDLASFYNNLAIVLEDMGQLDEAEATTRQTIAIREKLVQDFPADLDYAVTLGGSYDNFAGFLKDQGRTADSLEWSGKAVRILEPIVARERRHDFARECLRGSHANHAQALDRLGRHAEAVRDWDRAIALADGERRELFKSRRALSLGDHVQAVALVQEQAQAKGVNNKTLYKCARICAIAATAVKEDSGLRERYAGQAVELLRRAIAAGYTGVHHPGPGTDEAFGSLRGREEFQTLLKQLKARMPAQNLGRK